MDQILSIIFSFSSVFLIGLLAVIVIKFGGHIHKNEYKYYWVASLIALVATVFSVLAQFNIVNVEIPLIYQIVFQGHLTFAFFVLVMFAGAFKPKSKPKITLMKVRRELAILGFIILIPHAVLLIVKALSALNPTGTLALIIMTPLFITSFPKIRKKMHPLKWRKLHKWAYAAYFMIFLHLVSITIIAQGLSKAPRVYDQYWWIRLIMYVMIFMFYSYLKFKYYILAPKPNKNVAK